MSAFAFIIRSNDVAALVGGTTANDAGSQKQWGDWMQGLQSTGHLKDAGGPLTASGGTVRGKKRLVTEGPSLDGKDVIGGQLLVEARDLTEALDLAKGCPILETNGAVEVRAVAQIGG